MSSYLKDQIQDIGKVMDKYGEFTFKMALSHLMDVGLRHLSVEDAVKADIASILAQSEGDEAEGSRQILSPGFQIEILGCAGALAKFTPFAILGYVKEHVFITN